MKVIRDSKYYKIIFLVFLSIFSLFVLFYVAFISPNVNRSINQEKGKTQYVLVNEDTGTKFERKNYLLGNDFVKYISTDNDSKWQTASRSVALSGIHKGQFDAMIVIPQDFSKRLLALKSQSPQQALIEYQVRDNQNEITNQQIQLKVNTILKNFNQRIVKMYFSSIIDNLWMAKQNVRQLSEAQSDQHQLLNAKVYQPFELIGPKYIDAMGITSIFEDEHKVFGEQQANFVTNVDQLMIANNTSLDHAASQSEELKQSILLYAQEGNRKLEKARELLDQQFSIHKEQLQKQYSDDSIMYKKEYDKLYKTYISEKNKLYDEENQGLYTQLSRLVDDFKQQQTKNIKELQSEIAEIESQVTQLSALRSDMAQLYYGDSQATPQSATETSVKSAILALAEKNDNQSKVPNGYYQTLNNLVEQIDVSSLNLLLTKLLASDYAQDSSNKEQLEKYQQYLTLVQKYATEKSITHSTSTNFQYLQTPTNNTQFTFHSNVLLTISPNTSYDLQLSSENQAIQLGNNLVDSLQSQLTSELSTKGWQMEEVSATDNTIHFKVTNNQSTINHEVADVTTDSLNDVDTQGDTLELHLSIPLIWNTHSPLTAGNHAIQYHWTIAPTDKVEHNEFSVYIDANQPLLSDIPQLLKQFSSLGATVQMITNLYANAENMDASQFIAYVNQEENTKKTLSELAFSDSIYWLYDNITDQEKTTFITDSLYKKFKEAGDAQYEKLSEQILSLQSVLGTNLSTTDDLTLYGTLNTLTKPNVFENTITELYEWLKQMNQAMLEDYDSWQENNLLEATSVIDEEHPFPEKSTIDPIATHTQSLMDNLKKLAETSKQISESTKKSAAKVIDITPTIHQLRNSTNSIQTDTKDLMANMQEVVAQSKKMSKDNHNFATNFGKVLDNTKNGGSDNPQVFNFLSDPLQVKGVLGKVPQISFAPYYATLIGTLLTFVLALSIQNLMRRNILKNILDNRKETILWQNIPNLRLILITTMLLASIFAGGLTKLIHTSYTLQWFGYSFLVFVVESLLITAALRQFKKIAIYFYILMLSVFLMLTPLLGITIKANSFLSILFKVSPLQNIQNGYTAMINGISIGWLSFACLTIGLVVGVVWNGLIYPEVVKENEKIPDSN